MSSQQGILQQALALHQAGRLHEAEALYRQILAVEPDHPDALHYFGMLAYQVGKNEIAIELISRALKCRPDYINAHNNLGIVLNDQGRPDEAIASFQRALALRPDHAEVHFNLGNTLKDQGKLNKAAASYRQALSLNPDYAEAHNNLGIIYKDQGNLDEAVASFRKALFLKPDYAEAHYNLGNSLNDQGKLDEAVASYRKAISLRPDYAEAHYNLGNVFRDKGKADEAVASYRQVLSLKPGYVDAHNNLGGILKDQGKLDEAIASFQQALTLNPDSAEMHYNLGVIFRESGKLDDAIASYKKALSLKSDYGAAFKDLTSIVKFAEVDDVIHTMEGLYNKKEDISATDRLTLGFALGKVFEDLGDYDKSFHFIHESNQLKRRSYEYSIQKEHDILQKIKKTFSHDFFTSHHGWGIQDRTPIFIVGMPRSGTTLVEQILASHPLVFGAGELDILTNLITGICPESAAAQFPECITELGKEAFIRMGSDYINKIREYSIDAQYITDKMPYNFLHVGFIKTILPDAKVIHCMRNPMDTCFSIYKNYFKETHGYAYDMNELGQYYNLYLDLMAHWEKMLPGFMYILRYEDMIADQQDQTENLLDFCGLPWDEACLAFHKTERKVSTASLAQVRQPIYRDSVELWKRYEKQLEPLRKAISG
ncbi:tetratricopeptide repeat protein [Thermodesulfobacteriota bacterium]